MSEGLTQNHHPLFLGGLLLLPHYFRYVVLDNSSTQVYYRDAAAAFVVFDLTRIATFEAAAKWKDDLDMKVETIQ